jgi:hypothetical protein
MSSAYNNIYEMSYIPCAHKDHNAALEDGNAIRNVDGKVVGGGIMINGKCVPTSNQKIFAINGFAGGVRYTASVVPSATNAHTAIAAARNHL